MSEIKVRSRVGQADVTLSAGKLAPQADGAVVVTVGETEVLTTATASRQLREGGDFFPLTVDVEERMYAAGKIPGSFFRREGRPTEKAILVGRLIDRPLRPSFQEGFRCETHVIATILSVDNQNPYDVVALNAASSALMISPVPFEGPIGAVRLAYRDGQWLAMPTFQDLEEAVFELVVAGKRGPDGSVDIVMVEAGATEDAMRLVRAGQAPSDEEAVARGLEEAKGYIGQMIDLQLELRDAFGEIAEVEFPKVVDYTDEIYQQTEAAARPRLAEVIKIAAKQQRNDAEAEALEAVLEELGIGEDDAETAAAVGRAFRTLMKQMMRDRLIEEGVRLDGRGPTEIRPLAVEAGVIDRAHGSGLFQRGETQVLNVATLGMLRMEQMLDTISIEESKRYMHHYNFPPFSTGETGFMRGPKRREIGHGALAEKALLPVVPTAEEFPYAFRLVSEVLSSNGSSSMASVCGSSLSLMDAGVPITQAVAGVAMGLIAHDGGFVTLTDILGVEDALGDMDFKVAGTADVVTALQLDTKVQGLPAEVLAGALQQAKEARLIILDAMNEVIAEPRSELAPYAPRIEAVSIPRDKIGDVIGPKGKMIRDIEEQTGATLEIEDEGLVRIGASDGASLEAAKELVLSIAFPPEAEVGQEYEGEVVNITSFGAFVNILPGRDGLLHISKVGGGRHVERVEDVLSLGEKIKVVVRDIDRNGKVSLDLPGSDGDREADGDGERRDRSRTDRGRGDRSRTDRGRNDRGRRGGRDRKPRGERRESPAREKPGRIVVSFEDEFEKGS
ncbi:MAG: polyribonucleotide nucleotidyltransferase [Acidimicrobiia bacterium]